MLDRPCSGQPENMPVSPCLGFLPLSSHFTPLCPQPWEESSSQGHFSNTNQLIQSLQTQLLFFFFQSGFHILGEYVPVLIIPDN